MVQLGQIVFMSLLNKKKGNIEEEKEESFISIKIDRLEGWVYSLQKIRYLKLTIPVSCFARK